MISHDAHDDLLVSCSTCAAEQYAGGADLGEFLARLQRDGWRLIDVGMEAFSYCPECVRGEEVA